MKSDFLTKLEAKVKAAEQKWEESKVNLDERDIKELRDWLTECLQEQFLSNIPEKLEPGSKLLVESAWFCVSISKDGYNFGSRALFPERYLLDEFLDEYTKELSNMLKRQVKNKIDFDALCDMRIQFYFFW